MNLSASAWQINRSDVRGWINSELFLPTVFTAGVCTIIVIIEQVNYGFIRVIIDSCHTWNDNMGGNQLQKYSRKRVCRMHMGCDNFTAGVYFRSITTGYVHSRTYNTNDLYDK